MTNPAQPTFSSPAFAELPEDTQRRALSALVDALEVPRYDLALLGRQARPWSHAQAALLSRQKRGSTGTGGQRLRSDISRLPPLDPRGIVPGREADTGDEPIIDRIVSADAANRVELVLVDHNRLTPATRAKAEAMTAAGYRATVQTPLGLVVVGDPKGIDPSTAPRSRLHAFGIKRPKTQYILTREENHEIAAATQSIPVTHSEIQLAFYAAELADKILNIDAWNSDFVANQRLTYDPRRDAAEVGRHALNLALMRTRMVMPPVGDSEQHASARAAIAEQRKILDVLEESLRRRVAAMWAYLGTLEELDERLRTLRTLESVIQLTPELEALAVQIDRDMLATDQLARNVSETKALTEQVDHLVQVLQSTLAPLPLPPDGRSSSRET